MRTHVAEACWERHMDTVCEEHVEAFKMERHVTCGVHGGQGGWRKRWSASGPAM